MALSFAFRVPTGFYPVGSRLTAKNVSSSATLVSLHATPDPFSKSTGLLARMPMLDGGQPYLGITPMR